MEKGFLSEKEKRDIEKLGEKIRGIQNRARFRDYREEVNNNRAIKENNGKLVNRTSYLFFKIMTILFFIVFLAIPIIFGYSVWSGKLNGIIQSHFNSTINNAFNFTANIDNQYEHKIQINNSFVINNNIECLNSSG